MDAYRQRHIARQLHIYMGQFPVVLLLGARQVGKSTFLAHELGAWSRIDLEDIATEDVVASEPALFLRDHPGGTWFDEAQRVPALFAALRVAVDRNRRPGRYVLSSSASPVLVRQVSDSLAGRAGVLELLPFTTAEGAGLSPSLFLKALLSSRTPGEAIDALSALRSTSDEQIKRSWFRGGFPEPYLLADDAAWSRWFGSYIRLVSERDLSSIHSELRPATVRRLLRMLAARHGQQLNIADLGRDFGVRSRLLARFLDILEGTFLWQRVQPFHRNVGKRLVRRPRGYMTDNGLLHSLLGLDSLEDLLLSPVLGASWEGYILGELSAAAQLLDLPPALHFWRTHQGAEVDVVFERGGRLLPVEIKHTARIRQMEQRGLRSFLDAHPDAPFGVMIHRGTRLVRSEERIVVVPANLVV